MTSSVMSRLGVCARMMSAISPRTRMDREPIRTVVGARDAAVDRGERHRSYIIA
jgi:hypothetical protein